MQDNKREEEGGRGSYKFQQFLTLPPPGPNEWRNIPLQANKLKSLETAGLLFKGKVKKKNNFQIYTSSFSFNRL